MVDDEGISYSNIKFIPEKIISSNEIEIIDETGAKKTTRNLLE